MEDSSPLDIVAPGKVAADGLAEEVLLRRSLRIHDMLQWLKDNETILWSMGGLSVVVFLAGLVLAPILACSMSADYFAHDKRPPAPWANQHPVIRLGLLVLKNILGVALVLAGLAMLVLPGQGLLTLLVGLVMIDLPGKYRVEKWLVRRPWVHRPINWMRCRRGRAPLTIAA